MKSETTDRRRSLTIAWLERAAPVHVIDEQASPPGALVWTMLCGEQVVAFDDGTLAPPEDFFSEEYAKKATCPACRAAKGLS